MQQAARQFSFSGRADRHDLLVVSVVLGIVELARMWLPLPQLLSWCFTGLVLWIGCAAMARRLHDTGRSGWWMVGGLAFSLGWMVASVILCMMAFGLDALRPGNALYPVSLGIAFLAPMGALLWLHVQPGDAAANRFGLPRPARAKAAEGVGATA
jgi:uncharacterized membrane protein YhaH (DUF805 family)